MAAQFSNVKFDKIEYSFWLVFDDTGGVRMTRGHPQIGRKERRLKMSAVLPQSLFKEPELQAKISVPDQNIEPMAIDIEAVKSALETVIGVDIELIVKKDEPNA